ncbi:haloacid dehalogenase type II [Paracoccus sediminicola]|uniref:haloacid dehalogenase type II n=1 Tax=Paracoccus sediminicola TaxID=3017783 RepID=UPI0022F08C9F|nr:haloacid dehalogenase type II [Paracoccus sediminicola]WBU55484.1 haloacid dehalogenase type II [Paracoccus sediminicola]
MIFVFDAYGTLFDVDGAAREAAKTDPALHENWAALSADWRRKQLEYSWLRAITGDHVDFWQVTAEALDWAAERHGVGKAQAVTLLKLYRALPAYPEVPHMLDRLRAKGAATAIFSNGAPEMLRDAVASAGLAKRLDTLLSVETAGRFKPAAEAYGIVTDHFGCAPGAVTFVSSNGWDIYGATRFGFDTVWVNRAGLPTDRLPRQPGRILSDLTELA